MHSKFGYSSRANASSVSLSISGGSMCAGMWIETFGGVGISGASVGDAIRRTGLRPKATAAISSMRASAIRMRGTSSASPNANAKPAPGTK
jgi:hypothetical protein